MKNTVLFVGDVNVDLNLSGLKQDPVLDREILATGFELTIGSSAAIAAVAHACLGAPTAFFGIAGDDEYGRYMTTQMAAVGIDVGPIALRSDLRTGVTVNLVRDQHRTQVTYPGAIPLLEATPADFDKLAHVAHVHFAGIYQQTRLLDQLAGLIDHLRGRGVSVSIDPQWDESEQWKHAADWLPRADIVFVNADEARSLTKAATLADASSALARQCRCVVVKDGAQGAVVLQGGHEYRVAGHKVTLVDTIGAGDNFAAGFLYARVHDAADTQAALAFANACAARSCAFAGGTGARSRASDIVQFLKERE